MFGKFFKILSGIAAAIPVVKDIWYSIKKNVPRVICPRCAGSGKDPKDGSKCERCNGSGKVRSTDV